MRHVRLIYTNDDDYGNEGFLLAALDRFRTPDTLISADTDGRLIAHDLLEHQNGLHRIGDPDDEIEALGGLWQVRGRWGDLVSDYTSAYNPDRTIAYELLSVLEDFGDEPTFDTPKIRPVEEIDDVIDELEKLHTDQTFITHARALMSRGFRKAERRFGYDSFGFDQFVAIRCAIKDQSDREEGAEYRLSYGKGRASCVRLH